MVEVECRVIDAKAQTNICSADGLQNTQMGQSDIAFLALEQDPILF